MPWEAKLSCAALDGADDLVGDVLMNVEAFVCHDISPLLAGRHCGASMRPERAGRTGAGGKKAGQGIEGGAAVDQWPRRPFFGGDRSCGGTEKGLAPVARSARDAAIRGPLAASEERGMVGRKRNNLQGDSDVLLRARDRHPQGRRQPQRT